MCDLEVKSSNTFPLQNTPRKHVLLKVSQLCENQRDPSMFDPLCKVGFVSIKDISKTKI